MTEILKPEIDLDGGWELLMEKYKLNTVMSEIRIQAIWRRMKACAGPVVWYELQEEKREVLAASTLGAGIDRLQEEWVLHGQLLDTYAADCLAMEALLCLYRVLEAELQKKGYYINQYIFEEGSELGQLLEHLQADIHLSAEGMMQPLKSVAYRGILTKEAGRKCNAVCDSCERGDCHHRQSLHMGNYREPGVLKYSYGYQRIFGQK